MALVVVIVVIRLWFIDRQQDSVCGIRAKRGALIRSFAMLDSDRRPEIEAADELLADMPLPSDAKTFFLGGIFLLAVLTAA
jgi:hypothetical protein